MSDKHSSNPRTMRASIAEQTLAILEEGQYVNGYNRKVEMGADVQQAIRNSVLYRPSELSALRGSSVQKLTQKLIR